MNDPANPNTAGGLRTTGGHIHVGYDNPNEETNMNIVKALDLFLGVPSIIYDDDEERRKLYGKAGCFRFKKYGIEYRTLSNFWLKNKEHMEWVYEKTLEAIEFVNQQQSYLLDNFEKEIRHTIDNADINGAIKLMNKFNITYITECAVS